MNIEVLCWIDRPGYSGVLVKENGKLVSLDFTKVNQLLDKVDKSTWGRLCWQEGYGNSDLVGLPETVHEALNTEVSG